MQCSKIISLAEQPRNNHIRSLDLPPDLSESQTEQDTKEACICGPVILHAMNSTTDHNPGIAGNLVDCIFSHAILPTIHGMIGWYDRILNQGAKGISVSGQMSTMAQSTLLPSRRAHNRNVCNGKCQIWCIHASQNPMQQYLLLVLKIPQHQTCLITQINLVYMGLPLSSSFTVIRSEWKDLACSRATTRFHTLSTFRVC